MDNKLEFQEELGWVKEKRIPIICLPGGMTDELGGAIFEKVVEGIMALDCELLVRGIGSEKYGKLFTKLENEHGHRMKILKDTKEMRHKMYAAADISLFFVADEQELLNCLAFGAVPVSPKHDDLSDYDPIQEAGNSFISNPNNSWTWYAALVRAIETYKLPYDWKTIQKHCMETIKED